MGTLGKTLPASRELAQESHDKGIRDLSFSAPRLSDYEEEAHDVRLFCYGILCVVYISRGYYLPW